MRLLATALLLTAAIAPAAALCCPGEGDAPKAPPEAEAGPRLTLLLGDQYRWPHLVLPLRFAADLVAIPASVPRWEQEDFGTLALYAGAVGALMTPTANGLSPDTMLQRWVRAGRSPGQYLVWTTTGDALIWGSIWALSGGMLAYGWWAGNAELLESFSLMLEAFSLAQVSQVVFKFALGREGPRDAQGLGLLYGPKGFFRLFPAGTPSGHAAALYAMIGALSEYWQYPLLDVPLHLFGIFFAVTLITDDYHFISDVLWGAAMGYYQGKWVVRNRSSHYRYRKDRLLPDVVVPVIAPSAGSYGLSLGWTF
ncbi:MAG: phosphatase PAP2 family protein [Myxococcaceae bacterium]